MTEIYAKTGTSTDMEILEKPPYTEKARNLMKDIPLSVRDPIINDVAELFRINAPFGMITTLEAIVLPTMKQSKISSEYIEPVFERLIPLIFINLADEYNHINIYKYDLVTRDHDYIFNHYPSNFNYKYTRVISDEGIFSKRFKLYPSIYSYSSNPEEIKNRNYSIFGNECGYIDLANGYGTIEHKFSISKDVNLTRMNILMRYIIDGEKEICE